MPGYWIVYCRKCAKIFSALQMCKCGPVYARWEKASDQEWQMDLMNEAQIEEIENGSD